MIALGGGVSSAGDFMLDAVRPQVDELTTMVPKGTTEIVVASLGNDAGQVGAATMAFRGGLRPVGSRCALGRSSRALALFGAGGAPVRSQSGDPIHKIQHVVIIMQENRSFDTYFGTFPGADGIPMHNGVPTVCVPDPRSGDVRAAVSTIPTIATAAGRTAPSAAVADIDGGKMDGFIASAERGAPRLPRSQRARTAPAAYRRHGLSRRSARLPNYWAYARDFVLQDRMFEPNASWSLPQHLFMVSEWSAWCTSVGDPMSCVNELQTPDFRPTSRSQRSARAPGRAARLRVDRSHLPAARAPRELGVLRDGRHRARLRQRRRSVRAGAAERARRRASGIRCRTSTPSSTTASSATSATCATSTRPRADGTLPQRRVDLPGRRRTASIRRRW